MATTDVSCYCAETAAVARETNSEEMAAMDYASIATMAVYMAISKSARDS